MWIFVFIAFLGVVATAEGQALANATPRPGVYLTLREGSTIIRQTWAVNLTGNVTTCRFEGFPSAADASSVVVDGDRSGLQVLEWRRVRPGGSGIVPAEQSGRSIRIDLENADSRTGAKLEPEMQAVLSGSAPGPALFDLIYTLTGITWRVSYDVVVRGDLADFDNPLSVDVDGRVVLANQSGASFSNAVIGLAAGDSMGKQDAEKMPGFLLLDEDSPLADLWRFREESPAIPHLYLLPGRHEVAAAREASVLHVAVQRKQAKREVVIQAGQIPTDSRSAAGSARLLIKFKNEADYGRGKSVPPGPASVYLGSQQSTIFQQAWFNHTPADGDIEIDMGLFDGLSIRRFSTGRAERIGGDYEQSYEIRIENRSKKEIPLTVNESPPLDDPWTFLRSNLPVQKTDDRLIFSHAIPADSQLIIQYAVRVEAGN